MKKIVLCADDYGQSEAISRGIFELAAAGRLSAASCMTEGPFWRAASNPLPGLRGRIDIGLHFNLTHGFDAPATPLSSVIAAALSGRIDKKSLTAALHDQLDRFEAVLKQPPDFVDGHQHVHILPGIRRVLLDELNARYPQQKPYLRAVNPALTLGGSIAKLAFLKMLNTGFAAAARRCGFATTARLLGVYSLNPAADYGALMQTWLRAAAQGDVLICHPGMPDANPEDPIAETRPRELDFLLSPQFGEALADHGIQLSRFRDL